MTMRAFIPAKDRAGAVSFNPIRRDAATHSGAAPTTLPGHDFNRIPVHAETPAGIQRKPTVNAPGDAYEQEADRVARQVMDAPGHSWLARREAASGREGTRDLPGGGSPLPDEVRAFMEPRFGFDFARVRVHTDHDARQMSRGLNAQAFTHREHIYFGAGRSPGKDALTAHELTHVVQQTGGRPAPGIQRALEVRPPGPGEASAFDRRQELIDRLNTVSPAIQYRLNGRRIEYDVIDEATLTHFDRQMRDFIDRAQVVPMRLITSAGRVMGRAGYQPLLADSFIAAYVDLDDLLADDDYSFQSDLIHFLTERFQVRDYERLIGTDFSAQFDRAHRAGKNAEAALLQDVLNDPSIYWVYEETKPNGTWVSAFKSRDEGYWVFQIVRRSGRAIAGGEMQVKTRDGRRITIEEFRAERGITSPTPASAPTSAPASAPATAPAVP